ncbi:hypothetical protein BU204_02025 [Actinophytocola xanthii]|uniref:Phytoene synthase n=1 Tax=Actinophytocola xanthii TaxID=1912961 RepID=A0A1Q8CXS1_9PSEU|nr:hypothetical protein BU204_02025 [Actinophytocola xanthii]
MAGSRSTPTGEGSGAELLALVRSVGFAGRIPDLRRRARTYVATYDAIVPPIVESTVDDPVRRAHVVAALRSAGVKLCFLIAGYAATAGIPLRVDLGVLAGVVTRAYDDLLDDRDENGGGENGGGGDSAELDRRLAELFAGGSFHPVGDLERLFLGIYREVERRLDRPASDPIFAALRRLHEFQIRSRRQRDPGIPSAELAEVTRGKGAYGTVVMLGLARPAMGEAEMALLRELGGVLQQLDDCQDVELDRRAGVTTAATRGQLTLGDVCRRLRELAPVLRAHYGRVRPLYAVVYVYLWFCFVRRRWPRLGTGHGAARTPFGILLRPGDNVGQRASDRHER